MPRLWPRGYQVAIHYHGSAERCGRDGAGIERAGRPRGGISGRCGREADVDRLFDEVVETFGRLDVLVTAAAVWERKPLEESRRTTFAASSRSTRWERCLCCRRAGLIMAAQPEGGAIITIGDWAIARPYPDYAAYFASKGAIPAVTPAWPWNWPGGTRRSAVNCILPGPVMLPENLPEHEVKGAVAGTLVETPGQPRERRPGGRFPGRKRLRHRHLSAGRRRPNDRRRTVRPIGVHALACFHDTLKRELQQRPWDRDSNPSVSADEHRDIRLPSERRGTAGDFKTDFAGEDSSVPGQLAYNHSIEGYFCPASVLRERRAHCYEGAVLAAAMLQRIGFPPLLVNMFPEPGTDDEHCWPSSGSTAPGGRWPSRTSSGLRFREPVYRTLRELVMSYFEPYFNLDRKKTLRSYARPLDLTAFDRYRWQSCDETMDRIERRFDPMRRTEVLKPSMAGCVSPVDERSYQAGLLGSDPPGLFVPRG